VLKRSERKGRRRRNGDDTVAAHASR
jgi:hypothetical protein